MTTFNEWSRFQPFDARRAKPTAPVVPPVFG